MIGSMQVVTVKFEASGLKGNVSISKELMI